MTVRPATLCSCVFMPTKEKTTTSLLFTFNEYFPSTSVIVPLPVPFTNTLTPGKPSPVPSDTTPFKVISCACRPKGYNKSINNENESILIHRKLLVGSLIKSLISSIFLINNIYLANTFHLIPPTPSNTDTVREEHGSSLSTCHPSKATAPHHDGSDSHTIRDIPDL